MADYIELKDIKKDKIKSDASKVGKEMMSNVGKAGHAIYNFINPPKSQEQIAFERKLADARAKTHRDAVLKETLRQEKARAIRQVQQKYQPARQNMFGSVLMDAPAKTKKGKLKQQMKQDNSAFNKLMYG